MTALVPDTSPDELILIKNRYTNNNTIPITKVKIAKAVEKTMALNM